MSKDKGQAPGQAADFPSATTPNGWTDPVAHYLVQLRALRQREWNQLVGNLFKFLRQAGAGCEKYATWVNDLKGFDDPPLEVEHGALQAFLRGLKRIPDFTYPDPHLQPDQLTMLNELRVRSIRAVKERLLWLEATDTPTVQSLTADTTGHPRQGAGQGNNTISSHPSENVKLSLGDVARQVADSFFHPTGGSLGKEVVASFQLTDPGPRAQRLLDAGNDILVRMLPVIGWIERNRPGSAELVKIRLNAILDEATACSRLEIPEYAGGVIARSQGDAPPSDGARRTAQMVVQAMAFSESLRAWSDEIDAADAKAQDEATGAKGKGKATYSADFTSVNWFGAEYQFKEGLQAACVRLLWEAWRNGTPSLSNEIIGETAGSSNDRFRLEHVFKPTNKKKRKREAHPAWGTMIKSVGKGLFALSPP